MNSKKAKQLRRAVYANTPLNIERTYVWYNGTKSNTKDSLRAIYQSLKRSI